MKSGNLDDININKASVEDIKTNRYTKFILKINRLTDVSGYDLFEAVHYNKYINTLHLRIKSSDNIKRFQDTTIISSNITRILFDGMSSEHIDRLIKIFYECPHQITDVTIFRSLSVDALAPILNNWDRCGFKTLHTARPVAKEQLHKIISIINSDQFIHRNKQFVISCSPEEYQFLYDRTKHNPIVKIQEELSNNASNKRSHKDEDTETRKKSRLDDAGAAFNLVGSETRCDTQSHPNNENTTAYSTFNVSAPAHSSYVQNVPTTDANPSLFSFYHQQHNQNQNQHVVAALSFTPNTTTQSYYPQEQPIQSYGMALNSYPLSTHNIIASSVSDPRCSAVNYQTPNNVDINIPYPTHTISQPQHIQTNAQLEHSNQTSIPGTEPYLQPSVSEYNPTLGSYTPTAPTYTPHTPLFFAPPTQTQEVTPPSMNKPETLSGVNDGNANELSKKLTLLCERYNRLKNEYGKLQASSDKEIKRLQFLATQKGAQYEEVYPLTKSTLAPRK